MLWSFDPDKSCLLFFFSFFVVKYRVSLIVVLSIYVARVFSYFFFQWRSFFSTRYSAIFTPIIVHLPNHFTPWSFVYNYLFCISLHILLEIFLWYFCCWCRGGVHFVSQPLFSTLVQLLFSQCILSASWCVIEFKGTCDRQSVGELTIYSFQLLLHNFIFHFYILWSIFKIQLVPC